jgi:hypothetical protein
MNLEKLAANPQLTKMSIDDEDTVKQFGESVDFYIYDRQDMATFMKLATVSEDNADSMIELVEQLVLNEEGNQILTGGKVLPPVITMKIVQKVVESLGNSVGSVTQS